ncbi:MAG: beta-galactosidase [Phycisphaeraceae bacterium]|nr:beta-galactosidase [Phycisphaeraceae bacterium]
MPLVSYDSRSFSIDSRRVWLVSGSIHYARVPRGQWRDRLRAACEAGLNCVETPVVWSMHEREPGVFDFEDDLDLRHFVKAAAEEGLYCMLRPGPYVGSMYDFGGLPPYLHGVADKKGNRVRFREDEPQFLEAVDRFFRALMQQVGDLQVASPGAAGSAAYDYAPGSAAGGYQGEGGGPIVTMQVEHAWESHHPEQPYLDRLVSMLRQHGCAVPLTNANNLWQPVEGTVDTWRGDASLPAIMRQLSVVQPEAPTIVSQLDAAAHETAGPEQPEEPDPDTLAYRVAGLIGVGAQFNLSPFHAGTNLGFAGAASSSAIAAPLGEAGQRGDAFRAAKRLCTFASQFGHVLANSEGRATPSVSLNEADHPAAVLHQRSSQGELVMLIKSAKDRTKHTELMLGSGLTLDVPHAGQRAAWVLLDTNLGGRTTLDYTSLSPWALIDRKLLVVFGPAGATGQVSIDGQHHNVTVPTGKTPLVIEGDPVHIAVLNHDQIDAAYRCSEGLLIGCDGFDDAGRPVPLAGWGTQITISPGGGVQRKRVKPATKPTAPRLGKWQTLSLKALVDGTDPGYQSIEGPAPLGALSQGNAYGWYRLNNAKPATGKVLPRANGGRLHLYQKDKLAALLGRGEGADQDAKQLKLAGDTVVFVDALEHRSLGQGVGADPKGLADHLYTVKPIKAAAPEVTKQPAGDPFAVSGYVHHQRTGARPMSEALAWTVKPESRKPVILGIDGLDQPCVISVNDEPVHYHAGTHGPGLLRLVLDPAELEPMTGGKNTIKLELLGPLAEGVKTAQHVHFYQTTGIATPKDGWAFAPWTIPAFNDDAWRSVPKTLPSQPSWLGCTFNTTSLDAPLYLDPQGMSKGQIILNGHHLGGYWQQTREGKLVDADKRYYLPEAWLRLDEPNELMLFDEHGRTPGKCRLVYSAQSDFL